MNSESQREQPDIPTASNETPRKGYGPRWVFFVCDELDCGFYFRATKPFAQLSPIEAFVDNLGRRVKLTPMGNGEQGFQKLLDQGMQDSIFPVDLFARPFRIHVNVSKTVSTELHERWLRLIAFVKGEPYTSNRKEYVLEQNSRIVKRKLLSTEEFQELLEQEAEKRRTNTTDQLQPGTWRLATTEEQAPT